MAADALSAGISHQLNCWLCEIWIFLSCMWINLNNLQYVSAKEKHKMQIYIYIPLPWYFFILYI